MQTHNRNTFTTIHTEGALLPVDLLQRIRSNDKNLQGLSPESYHLAPGEKLNEAINRSWNRLSGLWDSFQAARVQLGSTDPGTTLTRERWLQPLFQELGFGRLSTSKAVEIEGKSYPISHRWLNVPLHLVGCGIDLDKRTPGAAGASRTSPHSLMQEYLNRSDDAQWGVISNGLGLRILRDNATLTRQAYIEFDLESMFDGEVYSDFVLLWLICHQSRFEVEEIYRQDAKNAKESIQTEKNFAPLAPSRFKECWLEVWSKSAQESGTRALDDLRRGVEEAIVSFGQGFLQHPLNGELRSRLKNGDLSAQDYYRQLLRLVYRLIFLFAAEDRDLLLLPGAAAETRQRFQNYYSTTRLRALAQRQRGSRHHDRYEALRIVFFLLSGEDIYRQDAKNAKDSFDIKDNFAHLASLRCNLALPALGGFLFDARSTADLNEAKLDNHAFFHAVRSLAFITEGNTRRAVDYRNLGPEELGSVYESLLELHPLLNTDAGTFQLTSAAGNERKTTGSYYTPSSLIQVLLDSALDPVIEEAVRRGRRIANGEFQDDREQEWAYSIVSRPGSMATRYGAGRTGVQPDGTFPAGGDVRTNQSDAQSSSVDPGKHRRGVGQVGDEGISTLSQYRHGQPAGDGDSSATQSARGLINGGTNSTAAGNYQHPGQTDSFSHAQPGEKEPVNNTNITSIPLAARYSLFTESALLSLKVCDPACGSGHFLIAAAHRIAGHLAEVRAGDNEPSPNETRRALRDVIRHCIYGVDINPMAVELCKVNLWLESIEPGKPLSFLDAHIKCGNSLVGVGPKMDIRDLEVPDEAFTPMTGDHKATAALLKKRNKQERAGQESLFITVINTREDLDRWLAERTRTVESMPEDNAAEVQAKAEAYQKVNESNEYRKQRQIADLWTAAFFWKIEDLSGRSLEIAAPTHAQLRRLRSGSQLQAGLLQKVQQLSEAQGFFHWPLEFAEVTAQGGFDCVLGNPPWERIKLQEEEFFAARDQQIAAAPNKAARTRLIKALEETNPVLFQDFEDAKHAAECASKFVRKSERYPLTAVGDVNTYALFAEHFRNLSSAAGRAGVIVPTGIGTDDTTKDFFGDLVEKRSLASLFDFENRENLFPAVDSRMKFCLLTLSGAPVKQAQFVFFATRVEHLRDDRRCFTLDPAEIALFNPNTRTMPIFRTRADAELTRAIYQRVPVLVNERTGENPWGVSFLRMFDMSNDSHLFITEPREGYVRLYEGKYVWHYDHRWATYEGGDTRELNLKEKQDLNYTVFPRYWVPKQEIKNRLQNFDHKWLITFRNITNVTNERTSIFSIIPLSGVGHNAPLIFTSISSIRTIICKLGNLNSIILDYCARQKIGGTNLTYGYLRQFPVLTEDSLTDDSVRFISTHVIELVFTAFDLQPFAQDILDEIGMDTWNEWFPHSPLTIDHSPIPFPWDEDRRALLRAELDAYYARLYGLNRKQLRYILDPADLTPRELEDILDPWEEVADPLDPAGYDARRAASDFPGETFRVLKDKEIRQFGQYRTRRLVLEAWNRLEGVEVGNPDSYSAQSVAVPPKQETISFTVPKSESRPATAQTEPVPPVKATKEIDPPAIQPTLSDFGLYKCEVCGKMAMGFEKANHEWEIHDGKGVQWKKMR
jgi:hypothetical protein